MSLHLKKYPKPMRRKARPKTSSLLRTIAFVEANVIERSIDITRCTHPPMRQSGEIDANHKCGSHHEWSFAKFVKLTTGI